MATYNGEKYIRQQLDSILCQSRQPDEVIMCDDGSTDGTVDIIRKFIEENGLQDSWKLYQNEQNRGYPGNFYYAMGLCSGGLVFLADQDDIWYREKIERMHRVFDKQPKAMAVCCKLSLIDAEGSEIHSIMTPTRKTHKKGKGSLRQVGVDEVFYKYEWPGMTMAYRRTWYRSWTWSDSGLPHDFLIAVKAAEKGCFYQMNEILAYHRRHDHNAGGEEYRLNRLLQRERKLKEVRDYLQLLQTLAREDVLQTESGKEALQSKTVSMQGRYEALKSGRLGRVLGNARRHWRETRVITLLCDLIITLR